jgi:hypothetical protein
MYVKNLLPIIVVAGCLAGLAPVSHAQSSSPPPAASSQAPATSDKATTINCPPAAAAAAGQSGAQAVGSPQGIASGSGLSALPSVSPPQRIDGPITTIGSTRTNRILEVGGVKLEVEPSTVILVDCQPGSMTDLQEGTKIQAVYEVKEPSRNVATVIEAAH